jgi:hypothetical protein
MGHEVLRERSNQVQIIHPRDSTLGASLAIKIGDGRIDYRC